MDFTDHDPRTLIFMAEESHLCDACPADDIAYVTGYSKSDLRKDGWQWRAIPGKKNEAFVMCPTCVKRYEKAWEKKEKVG